MPVGTGPFGDHSCGTMCCHQNRESPVLRQQKRVVPSWEPGGTARRGQVPPETSTWGPLSSSEAAALQGAQTHILPLAEQTVLVLCCTWGHDHSTHWGDCTFRACLPLRGELIPCTPQGPRPAPGAPEGLVEMRATNRRLLVGILCVSSLVLSS